MQAYLSFLLVIAQTWSVWADATSKTIIRPVDTAHSPVTARLKKRVVAGFGAMMRAAPGSPAETLRALAKQGQASPNQLAEELGISWWVVDRDLSPMVKRGIVQHLGPPNSQTTQYQLTPAAAIVLHELLTLLHPLGHRPTKAQRDRVDAHLHALLIPRRPIADVAKPWAWLAGRPEQLDALLAYDAAQIRRLQDGSRPIILLMRATQFRDPLVSSGLLESMRRHRFFAPQGGAVHLVLLDEHATEAHDTQQRVEQLCTRLNAAHQQQTVLSRASIVSAVLPGRLAQAEALAHALKKAGLSSAQTVVVAADFAGTTPQEVAEAMATAWHGSVAAAKDHGLTMVPIISTHDRLEINKPPVMQQRVLPQSATASPQPADGATALSRRDLFSTFLGRRPAAAVRLPAWVLEAIGVQQEEPLHDVVARQTPEAVVDRLARHLAKRPDDIDDAWAVVEAAYGRAAGATGFALVESLAEAQTIEPRRFLARALIEALHDPRVTGYDARADGFTRRSMLKIFAAIFGNVTGLTTPLEFAARRFFPGFDPWLEITTPQARVALERFRQYSGVSFTELPPQQWEKAGQDWFGMTPGLAVLDDSMIQVVSGLVTPRAVWAIEMLGRLGPRQEADILRILDELAGPSIVLPSWTHVPSRIFTPGMGPHGLRTQQVMIELLRRFGDEGTERMAGSILNWLRQPAEHIVQELLQDTLPKDGHEIESPNDEKSRKEQSRQTVDGRQEEDLLRGAALALRAALDIASASEAQRAGAAQEAAQRYGVTLNTSAHLLVPFVAETSLITVPSAEAQEQLRAFQAAVDDESSQEPPPDSPEPPKPDDGGVPPPQPRGPDMPPAGGAAPATRSLRIAAPNG